MHIVGRRAELELVGAASVKTYQVLHVSLLTRNTVRFVHLLDVEDGIVLRVADGNVAVLRHLISHW